MTQEYSRDSGSDDSSDGDYTPDAPPSGTWIDPREEHGFMWPTEKGEGTRQRRQPGDLTKSTANLKPSRTADINFWYCTGGCCKFKVVNWESRELEHVEVVLPPQIKRQQPLNLTQQKPT